MSAKRTHRSGMILHSGPWSLPKRERLLPSLPAHASMMTGQTRHNTAQEQWYLAVNVAVPTVAELFRDAGWSQRLVSASIIDSQYGISRSFSTYNDHIARGKTGGIASSRCANRRTHSVWRTKMMNSPYSCGSACLTHRPWDPAQTPDQTRTKRPLGLRTRPQKNCSMPSMHAATKRTALWCSRVTTVRVWVITAKKHTATSPMTAPFVSHYCCTSEAKFRRARQPLKKSKDPHPYSIFQTRWQRQLGSSVFQ